MKHTILFITHYPGMYGANQSLCQLMLDLRKRYNVRPIVLISQRGDICKFLDQHDIQYYVSHFYWWVNADKGIFQKFLNYRKQIRNLSGISNQVEMLEKENIDLVYTNSVCINIGYWLSKRMHCPHIWHIRETLQAYDFKYTLPGFMVKRFFRKGADRYIVISDFVAGSYKGFLPDKKVKKIYNGLSLDVKNKKADNADGVLQMVMVGIMCEQKNQLDALKAVNNLKNKGLDNFKLHFIGGNKPDYLQKMEAYIHKNELENKVIIHGHKSNVSEILENMNVGVVCARDEAFGRVAIEYMLHKMPVIASKSGANEELVVNRQNGLLYDINNADDLASKMECFMKNPMKIDELGTFGKEYAESNFSLEQNTDAIYDMIKELVTTSTNK